mgnify:CR=1 FL=1
MKNFTEFMVEYDDRTDQYVADEIKKRRLAKHVVNATDDYKMKKTKPAFTFPHHTGSTTIHVYLRKMSSGVVAYNYDLKFDENTKVRQDKDVEDREGTQPAKYYKGVKSKSTKQARARHFEKGAKMDDDNPAAYTPAPGDKGGKTKPSKHTKKFKAMYGEEINEVTFGNPNATEADALPPKVVSRFVKEYKNADKLQTLVIRTKSKIRGSEQRETLDDLNKKVRDFKFALSDCIETGSSLVMDYTPDGDDLNEGKLVTGVDSVLSVITKKLKAEMGKRYKQNAEAGMKYINNIAKMVGMTASDKGQQKNRMFLRMSEETLDEKAPNTADAMKRYKAGKAGFTDKAHLKAKGLIPRADGTKRKSDKYKGD